MSVRFWIKCATHPHGGVDLRKQLPFVNWRSDMWKGDE
jgi:hypothetical protein